MPETAGRNFAKLNIMLEKRVGARKFKKTEVNVFEIEVHGNIISVAVDR